MDPHPTQAPEQPLTRLIITGDDFGISSRVNEEIEQAYEAGWLQQASLMVNGAALNEALQIARRHPGLIIGLHLTLCEGSASQMSRLTKEDQTFSPRHPAWAGLRYALDQSLRSDLEREIAAQFGHFRSLELGTSYWDGHCHLHLHPTILDLTLPLAGGFGWTRLVSVPTDQSFLDLIFNALSRSAVPKLQAQRVRYPSHVFGLERSGRMDTEEFTKAIRRIPKGALAEIYYHPGAENGCLDFSRLREVVQSNQISLCAAAGSPGFGPKRKTGPEFCREPMPGATKQVLFRGQETKVLKFHD